MTDLKTKPIIINLYKCSGCPIFEECPMGITFMSNECKELLKSKGEM